MTTNPFVNHGTHARRKDQVSLASRTHAGGGGCWAEWNYGRQGLLGPMELQGAEAVGPDGIKGVWLHVEKTRNNGLQHLHSTNYSYESINRSIQINGYLTMGSVDFICVAKFYLPLSVN